MTNIDLNSIVIEKLKKIATPGGDIMHFLKSSSNGYRKFGEVYFSWINENAIKAWKKHNKMTLNLVVPIGKVKFVFHDNKKPKIFKEVIIGENNYCRLTVPPGIWFGFHGIYNKPSLLANVADIEHDENEVERVDKEFFSFFWDKDL